MCFKVKIVFVKKSKSLMYLLAKSRRQGVGVSPYGFMIPKGAMDRI